MTKRSDIPRRFFTQAEQEVITKSIADAEKMTSGEIRLFIERDVKHPHGDAYERARAVFSQLGMHKTAQRNGVLAYLATRARVFAIVGDEKMHEIVGEGYWAEIRNRMEMDFANDRFAEGLAAGIKDIGASLARHFPPRPDDLNELPDDIAY